MTSDDPPLYGDKSALKTGILSFHHKAPLPLRYRIRAFFTYELMIKAGLGTYTVYDMAITRIGTYPEEVSVPTSIRQYFSRGSLFSLPIFSLQAVRGDIDI